MGKSKKISFKFLSEKLDTSYVVLAYAIVAIIFILVVVFVSGTSDYSIDSLFDDNNVELKDDIKTLINSQNKSVNKIVKASKKGVYSFNDPYVLINPFGVNELSAIIAFTTSENGKVFVRLNGKDMGETDATTNHIIPIYGLYEGTNNKVDLSLEDGSTKTVIIKTKSIDYNDLDNIYIAENNYLFNLLKGDRFSIISGYDYVGNLRFYLSGIDNIKGYVIKEDKIVLTYGSNGLYVDITIDYLGHIIDINKSSGFVSMDDIEYNIYSSNINNYDIKLFASNSLTNKSFNLRFEDVSTPLAEAKPYKDDFNAMLVDKKLYYDINTNGYIVLVRNDGQIESYKIDDEKVITINTNYNYSLYLQNGDTYYNLLTSI